MEDSDAQAALRAVLRGALPGEWAVLADRFTREELQYLIDNGFTDLVTLRLLTAEDVVGHITKALGRALLWAFAQGGAGAGAGAAADPPDQSGTLVHVMLEDLGTVQPLPRNAAEFSALLTDHSCMKIPVPAATMQQLQATLSPEQQRLLWPQAGRHEAAERFYSLINDPPHNAGGESPAMLAMQHLFRVTLNTLGRFSGFLPQVLLNITERGAGSVSEVIEDKLRPDMIIVYDSCTLMIGEDKAPHQLQAAQADIRSYSEGGLSATHYGSVPGIPAYAASGTQLRFMFISSKGQVALAGPLIDLSMISGRLSALCSVIHCYRLMRATGQLLPALVDRAALWRTLQRDRFSRAEVMLTPAGAVKTIGRFKAFATRHGVTQESVIAAYHATRKAATQQQQQGQLPFLVHATTGPKFSREGLEVHTAPLGFHKSISTELDAKRLARSCLRAAGVLHTAGIVHTDLRLSNVVWLDHRHCMVIDLELCRRADSKLPDNCPPLEGWDNLTLEQRGDGNYYTPASDLYQIGLMLQKLTVQLSPLAHAFIGLLISKQSADQLNQPLTADEALRHEWLQDAALA